MARGKARPRTLHTVRERNARVKEVLAEVYPLHPQGSTQPPPALMDVETALAVLKAFARLREVPDLLAAGHPGECSYYDASSICEPQRLECVYCGEEAPDHEPVDPTRGIQEAYEALCSGDDARAEKLSALKEAQRYEWTDQLSALRGELEKFRAAGHKTEDYELFQHPVLKDHLSVIWRDWEATGW